MANDYRASALSQIHRLFDEGTLAGLPDARLLERYASKRDELAFETLVKRHGRMVMCVCRGVVDDPNDADDAFQAAFLLLARKAGALWVNDSLGGWLHRIARRIALQVRSDAARRRDRERQAADRAGMMFQVRAPSDDVHTVLHQEIDRLPERYRKPIVLCYLEEMTYQQAASHLRLSEGTTRGRLARGRDMLRARLSQRGIQSAGAALPLLSQAPKPLLLTAEAVESTVRAARHFSLGKAAVDTNVSLATTTLVNQAIRSMMLTKLKIAATAALFLGMLACAAAGLATVSASGPISIETASAPIKNQPTPVTASPNTAAKDEGQQNRTVSFHGRVLGPDGKPAARARVHTLALATGESVKAVFRAKTGDDGKFLFDLPSAEWSAVIERGPYANLTVIAWAPDAGPDWVALTTPPDGELSLRLVDDSAPIAGRIVDLQGKPVAGVRITRGRIEAEGNEGIDPYLTLVREDPFKASNHNFAKNYWAGFELPGQPASVLTDAGGRFRLTGIGRDRIVDLGIESPTIQSATIRAMTRAGAKVSSPPGTFAAETIYPATFEFFVPPGRALTGVVRDSRTKQPLPGVAVAGNGTNARTKSDAQGRYTLAGFAKSKSYGLMVLAGDKVPYFVTCLNVSDTAGLGPVEADVECVPGIPMRLKLTDKESGKPVKNANVFYRPIYPNPHSRDVPGFAPVRGSGPYNSGILQDDGSYLIGVLPGPGGVFISTAGGIYRPACVDPWKLFNVKASKDSEEQRTRLYGDTDTILTTEGGEGWGGMPQSQFSSIVLVNPAEDSAPLRAEAVLERDSKREVRVLGPDGDALSGVVAEGEGAESGSAAKPATVSGLNPARPKRFFFRHDARKLIGFLIARGDEAEPYVVKLQPWATITGRLVDAQGKPRPKVDLMTSDWAKALLDPARGVIPYSLKTDNEGRFRYVRLVPGQVYSANAVGEEALKGGFGVVIDHVALKPGETKDLGNVQARLDKLEMKP